MIDLQPMPDVRLIDRSLGGDLAPAASRPALKPLTARRTVLVVDDDPLMLELLVRILRRENYEILAADCAESALRQAHVWQKPIDLLVTDYQMPEISGRELADALRVRQRDLPVLYQTGFTDLLFENRTELETRSWFLEKPFTPRGLLEAARFALFGTLNPAAT